MEGYKYHPLCKVCNARDTRGKALREEIDAMIAQGKKNVECIQLLSQHGISVTERNFSRHLTKHSPFAKAAKQTLSSKAIQLKRQLDIEKVESQELLQKIIAIGDNMIDNWWNDVENAPKMPVTEKLFIEAVKEEGRRAPKTLISAQLDEIEREFIEGHTEEEQPEAIKESVASPK